MAETDSAVPPSLAAGVAPVGETVVERVFDDFLAHLSSEPDVDAGVIDRLRTQMVEKHNLSPDALRAALFEEELE